MRTKEEDARGSQKGFTYEEALRLAEQNGEQVVPTYCAMCGPTAGCGLYAFVRDGRLLRVGGMAEALRNHGGVCPKGLASPQWLYAPERLKTPLLRTGERGEGKFVPISWDEAIAVIADRLKEQKERYGPQSLAILSPARRNYSEMISRFLTVHGSPNYGHSGICAMQRAFAFCHTIGGVPSCDYDNADLIVYWGRQPVFSGPPTEGAASLVGARKRKAKIVAVKPSMEPDAGMADLWLALRPGTDAALALSMLHVIFAEEWYDKEFVERWCYGVDAFCEHIRAYTPQWGEAVTGVAAEQICEAARLYAGTDKAVIDVGNGVEHAASCSDAVRAIAILIAVTGHLDRLGCNRMGKRGVGPKPITLPDRYTPAMAEQLVGPEFPREFQPFLEGFTSAYYRIFESVLTEKPYPIRTIIAPGTQPLLSTRNTRRVLEALKKVDFFVTIDVTKPAEYPYADLVLPTTTPYEADHPFEHWGNRLMARTKVVEPLGDYKSIFAFFLDLGVAMGYGADFWNGSVEAFENERLEPFQLTIDQLRVHKNGLVLPTQKKEQGYQDYEHIFAARSFDSERTLFLPQGKVPLYHTRFAQAGFAPMPQWREPAWMQQKEQRKRYPLLLSDYHTSKFYSASWLKNVPSLRELEPDPTVHIHPKTAEERGIADGDWVRITSPQGWLRVKAVLYPGIRPDTVMVPHGWAQGCQALNIADLPLLDGGANVNYLYTTQEDYDFDPLVTAMSSQVMVEVAKEERQEQTSDGGGDERGVPGAARRGWR